MQGVVSLSRLEFAVSRLQAGDRSALAPLYEAYAEGAIRTAFLITRNKDAAEEAVQEAFVQVIRASTSLRDPAAFRPWLYRIVINVAKRQAQRKRFSWPLDKEPGERIDLATPSPEEAIVGLEEIQQVRLAIAELGEIHREVIVLRYYSELSEEEIASVLSLPRGTVKSRLNRARELLQRRLNAPQKHPLRHDETAGSPDSLRR